MKVAPIADALLSDTAQLEDIFWGFYKWLDAHPTEALFVSLKVDNGPNDANLQQAVYGLLTSAQGKKYWVQKSGTVSSFLLEYCLDRDLSVDADFRCGF